jgi:DNA-directed RNA polymerase II subunit RPB2
MGHSNEDEEQFADHEFKEATWTVIEKYFRHQHDSQLIKHQIDTYNDFVLRKLEQVIEGFNTIEILHQYVPEHDCYKFILRIDIKDPMLSKPMISEKDGSTKVMTPSDARQRNFTYSAPLLVNMHVSASVLQDDGSYSNESKKLENVNIGKLPIMVKSRYCVLSNAPHLKHNECKHEVGGYFVVNGNEKVVISQDRIAENKTFCFVSNKQTYFSHIAEIRSVQDNVFSVPKATTLKLSSKSNQSGRYVRVNIHHVKHDIPLCVLFRALGVESDREICQFIVYDMEDKANEMLISELVGSIEDANAVRTQHQALEYLSRYLNISGYPKEILNSPEKRVGIVRTVLTKEFLPHVGPCFEKKAMYLGYMMRKLLGCYLGHCEFDDRDNYINKRIDSPGTLMTNLFRQYYGKLVKDMRNLLQKEINTGSWKANNRFVNVITKVNMPKIIKPTIIESGLKYCLATGNWGIKNARNKVGIAQVLNRMTFNAMLSHLRRINTPIEKTGKLVQPRKLHSTQWGIICPSETPDGASVGLVKNMALTTNITIASNSINVRTAVEHLGLVPFREDDLKAYAKNTWVIINGDIVGHAPDPNAMYEALKCMKRTGQINVYSSVVWDHVRRELRVSTESGRCVRPLYAVGQGGRLVFGKRHLMDLMNGRITWMQLVCGTSPPHEEGLLPAIEYLDVDEVNNSMIAMRFQDLGAEPAPNMLAKRHTHLEIHPSLMFGVLTSSIPFAQHNQAPRNTYQSAMGKQAVGLYATNFRDRYDTMAHVLNYPQKPLVQTRTSRLLHNDALPCGQNAIVAIATCAGYNQEDSVIMNESSVQRGLFASTYYRTHREQNNKNHANGEEEFFCRPDMASTKNLKPYNYDKLADDGFIPENTLVEGGDIIMGRCMPQKVHMSIVQKDTSVPLKSNNDVGFIDRNCSGNRYFVNTNGDGYTFAKVRIRNNRLPTVGDKFCLTAEHEVLTSDGWVGIADVTMRHQVATLDHSNRVAYLRPIEVLHFPDYDGQMYRITSNMVELDVTMAHRMFVGDKHRFSLVPASEVVGRPVRYMRIGAWDVDDHQLVTEDRRVVDMEAWLIFVGLFVASEGQVSQHNEIILSAQMSRVRLMLTDVLPRIGWVHSFDDMDRVITAPLRAGGLLLDSLRCIVSGRLPEWVWQLSKRQCHIVLHGILLGNGTPYMSVDRPDPTLVASTSSMADDFQRLVFHAGYSSNKKQRGSCWDVDICTSMQGHFPRIKGGCKDADEREDVYAFEGHVYCLRVPNEVFLVRRNGKHVWTGNSSRHGECMCTGA